MIYFDHPIMSLATNIDITVFDRHLLLIFIKLSIILADFGYIVMQLIQCIGSL